MSQILYIYNICKLYKILNIVIILNIPVIGQFCEWQFIVTAQVL